MIRFGGAGLVLLASVAFLAFGVAGASATIPTNSCVGTGSIAACADSPFLTSVGANSCNGNGGSGVISSLGACADDNVLTSVGANSCDGDGGGGGGVTLGACADSPSLMSVGANSCTGNGGSSGLTAGACSLSNRLTSVGANSCNGDGGGFSGIGACSDSQHTSVGDNACNGPNACSGGSVTAVGDCQGNTVVVPACPASVSMLGFSADTGVSSTDFITKIAAQTISGTLSGALVAGDHLYGSLDNGATWTDITSTVVNGTGFAWSGVTLTNSDTLKVKVTNSAGNDGAVASQAYVLDFTAPTANPTVTPTPNVAGWNNTNVTVNPNWTDTGGSGINVNDCDGPAAFDADGTFPLVFHCSDLAGNSGSSAQVTVRVDKTKPVLTVPADVTVDATSAAGAMVTYAAPTATDPNGTNGSGVVAASVGCFPVSGSVFPIGPTTVTCTASDLAGNTQTGAFTVHVNGFSKTVSGNMSGSLIVNAGELVLLTPGSKISGSVTVKPGGSLTAQGATISGQLNASGAATIHVCGTTITGSVTVKTTSGPVVIGDADGTPPCAGNKITGPVSITGNLGGVEFESNTVTGSLTITGNTAPVHASGNQVSGKVNIQS